MLVDFSDKPMVQAAAHFNELFFSTGALPNGSVKEYFTDVTGGLIDVVGEVVGPYRLPQTLAWYANNNFGIGEPTGEPRANIMARDAAVLANADVNFAPYDNDGNTYVDAFIVVHAGAAGEVTGNSGDIWSHKWVLPSVFNADGVKIYAYLTVPEDAKIGVCAHELGHLLFGFPDLYDTDYTSEGIGNWCLMAGGSWGGGGDLPTHPSAWCKVNQGWANVNNVTTNGVVSLPDVKTSRIVHRVWKDGASSPEYFLLENRQRTGFDASLPAAGLLIWHIDDNQPGNTDENHYKVGLLQADGLRDLEMDRNRGDAGDPYPGSANNRSVTASTTPSTKTYAGVDSGVSITDISPSGPTMTANISVTTKSILKDSKDRKDVTKEFKEPFKERKDGKDRKDLLKEPFKERKDSKDVKEPFKERKDLKDRFEGWRGQQPVAGPGTAPFGLAAGDYGAGMDDLAFDPVAMLEARVAALEEALGMVGGSTPEPFIGADLRPDLMGGPSYQVGPSGPMATGRDAKRYYDTPAQ